MSDTAERRLAKIRAYVEQGFEALPEPKDENDDIDDVVNDAIRETLDEVEALLSGPLGRTFAEIHIDGKGFRTVAMYRLFFKGWLRKVRQHRADYEQEVRDWYEENPGYQFPHCIHGSSLVTDYDNICGGCEDSATVVDEARGYAREGYLRFIDRLNWVLEAPGDLNYETREGLVTWAMAPWTEVKDLVA